MICVPFIWFLDDILEDASCEYSYGVLNEALNKSLQTSLQESRDDEFEVSPIDSSYVILCYATKFSYTGIDFWYDDSSKILVNNYSPKIIPDDDSSKNFYMVTP